MHNVRRGWAVPLMLMVACAQAPADQAAGPPNREPELVVCDGLPFPASALRGPVGAERSDDPAAAALREIIEDPDTKGIEPVPARGWRLLYRTEDEAQFGHGEPPRLADVRVKRTGRGWEYDGSGGCGVHPWEEGLEPAVWGPDPAFPPPGPDSRVLHVLVADPACTSGADPTERLQEPRVVYGEREVIVTLLVEPVPPGPYFCIGRPPVDAAVELEEPLGDRRLLDGGLYPPEEPTTPE